jgi:hypothetical protein
MHLSGRIFLAPSLAVGLGCATSGTPTRGQPQTVTIEVPDAATSRVVLRDDPSGSTLELAVPAARAWTAVPAAYNVLPIPVVAFDSTRRTIQGSASAYRRFLRSSVSRFVDCGSTIVGPSADSYRVQLSVESQVEALSDTTSSLHTRVDASAAGGSGTIHCSTTGSLERLVNSQVAELLGQQPAN